MYLTKEEVLLAFTSDQRNSLEYEHRNLALYYLENTVEGMQRYVGIIDPGNHPASLTYGYVLGCYAKYSTRLRESLPSDPNDKTAYGPQCGLTLRITTELIQEIMSLLDDVIAKRSYSYSEYQQYIRVRMRPVKYLWDRMFSILQQHCIDACIRLDDEEGQFPVETVSARKEV